MRSRCRCSMCSAIHINSRSWLRSSSTHEPSDPPLKVVICLQIVTSDKVFHKMNVFEKEKAKGSSSGQEAGGHQRRAGDSLNLAHRIMKYISV